MMWFLQALLFLLKLIGILLLSILCFILLILLIILFVPIRYQVKGSYYEKPNVNAKITWLLSAVTVLFQFRDSETDLKIKIFGFTLGAKKDKPKKEKKSKKKGNPSSAGNKTTKQEKTIDSIPNPEDDKSHVSPRLDQIAESTTTETTDTSSSKQSEEPTLTESDLEDLKESKKKKKIDTDDLKKKLSFIKEQWEDPGNRKLLKAILFRLKKIFLHLIPTKFDLSLHFGLDNPATMGQVLSILAMLYPIYGESIHLQPDFENQVVEGKGFIKGRIRLIVFVYATIRILLNPQVRILIRRFKRQNGADHE